MKGKRYPFLGLLVFSLFFYGTVSFSQEAEEPSSPMPVRWDMIRASDMLGVDLRSIDGQIYLARIDDLGINPSTGAVDYLIINDVRRMGMTQRYALPFKYVQRVDATRYIFNPPEPITLFRSYEHGVFAENSDFLVYLKQLEPMPVGHVKFTDLLGDRIQTSGGQQTSARFSAGEGAYVNDAVINLSDGHIVYLVLSDVGGVEGRMAAVPFGGFSWTGEDAYVLDTTHERFASSPVFTWDEMDNQGYVIEIYRYYGVQPYWEEAR